MARELLRCKKCEKYDKEFILSKRCNACVQRNYRNRNPNYVKYQKKYAKREKERAIKIYGGKYPECVCCRENTYEFLCLDHINGGGNKHRKEIGAGYNFYLWLRRNNYPLGFQVLCHNCNTAKSAYGICPHIKNKYDR